MPNQLNKNKNKQKEKDEIRTAQGNLILAQQAERRRRFQQIVDGHRSTKELLEETRQRLDLVEEARKEFLSPYTRREENPDGRELTHTARSVKGARAWSEFFVHDTLPEWTTSLNEEPSSPKNAAVGNKTTVQNSVGVGVQSASVGVQSVSVRVQSVGVGVQNNVSVGVQNNVSVAVPNSVGVAVLNSARTQNQVIMARPKEKLTKLDGDGTVDPIKHYKKCKTIWMANGITDTNEWVQQFSTTLRGVAIDWFADADLQKLTTWAGVKKEFITEFQLLRDDDEIVAEICSCIYQKIKRINKKNGK